MMPELLFFCMRCERNVQTCSMEMGQPFALEMNISMSVKLEQKTRDRRLVLRECMVYISVGSSARFVGVVLPKVRQTKPALLYQIGPDDPTLVYIVASRLHLSSLFRVDEQVRRQACL